MKLAFYFEKLTFQATNKADGNTETCDEQKQIRKSLLNEYVDIPMEIDSEKAKDENKPDETDKKITDEVNFSFIKILIFTSVIAVALFLP